MELGAYVGIARKTRSTTGVERAWGEGQLWGMKSGSRGQG
jgi:hypothetical protein